MHKNVQGQNSHLAHQSDIIVRRVAVVSTPYILPFIKIVILTRKEVDKQRAYCSSAPLKINLITMAIVMFWVTKTRVLIDVRIY
jgi:hypothetical protein